MQTKPAKNSNKNKALPKEGGVPAKKKRGARLKSLTDCRRFLARIVNELNKNSIEPDRARAFGYLLSILTNIIKDSDFETRISELERKLEEQNEEGNFAERS